MPRRVEKKITKVARIPPLPRIPLAPSFPPDPRQVSTRRIIGAIAAVAKDTMTLAGPNFVEGFPASAVNVGQLQEAMERGLRRFTGANLVDRWDDVFGWLLRVLRSWVQRAKHIKIKRVERAVRIEVQTQDDLGYYDYAFDVFPDRGGGGGSKTRE